MHSLATSYDLVKNIFLKTLFNTKSNDLICDLFVGQASSPLHNKVILRYASPIYADSVHIHGKYTHSWKAAAWRPIVVVVVQVNDTVIKSIVTDSQTDYIFVTDFDVLARYLDNLIRQACRVRSRLA